MRELCKGEYFTDQSATEQNFKRNADRFKIIHLATHAMIDNQNPAKSRLLFNIDPDSGEDGMLYSYELYGINLNAGLVTLSACNTGFGQVSWGKGVLSLARAFAYAGSPNVVMSLWPVDDQLTSGLVKAFYE